MRETARRFLGTDSAGARVSKSENTSAVKASMVAVLAPGVQRQAGFAACLLQKGLPVPAVLDGNLGQQQAAASAQRDDQAMTSDFNSVGMNRKQRESTLRETSSLGASSGSPARNGSLRKRRRGPSRRRRDTEARWERHNQRIPGVRDWHSRARIARPMHLAADRCSANQRVAESSFGESSLGARSGVR